MTRLGSYSVVRGAVDRDSFRLTRDMLAKGAHKASYLRRRGNLASERDHHAV